MTELAGGGSGATVVPRPAATVVLLRPSDAGLSVLLTRRPTTMAFAADMHVFPGGRVDAGDADGGLLQRSAIEPVAAARALGGDLPPDAAHAAFVAAIREAWEEVGVLLADTAAAVSSADVEEARTELLGGDRSFAELADRLDLRLWTDRLIPLSRWVTPPTMDRRFDARFFAAALPEGAGTTLVGEEVTDHAWWTPRAALDAMAEGRLDMWLPTSTTLQQLEHADSVDAVGARLTPGALGPVELQDVAPDVVRVLMPAGGGVAGQPVACYLVGRSDVVIVDPGDPTGPGLDAALRAVEERGARVVGVALTHVDPDHAAGAEALAELRGAPVFAGVERARDLPYALVLLENGTLLPVGDVPLRVVATPGPAVDHLAFVVGDGSVVLCGDLDGVRGARSIPGPVDEAAWATSRDRLRAIAPDARWLGGHPTG
jgi:ribonuclease/clavin/mitogillin